MHAESSTSMIEVTVEYAANNIYDIKSLDEDLADAAAEEHDAPEEDEHPTGAKNDTLVEIGSSELGLHYPTLQAIFAGKRTRQRIQVQAYHM